MFHVEDPDEKVFEKSNARLVLQLPRPDEARTSEDEPTGCHTATPTFKVSGREVKKNDALKPILNVNKDITVEITHNFDGCSDQHWYLE